MTAAPIGPRDTAPPVAPDAGVPVLPSRGRLVARRFARHRPAVAGLVVIVLLFLLAHLGPLLTPWSHDELDYTAFLRPPSAEHWFGTTPIGADVFAQTLRGLQKSLLIGLLVGVVATSVAAVVGAAAGYFGGWVDRSLMGMVDLLITLPSFLVVAIVSPAFRGDAWPAFALLLAAFSWLLTARIVRGQTRALREREFVLAARFTGVRPWTIIVRHILPNMSSLLVVDATITVGAAILAEAGLSFLGVGIQAPDVSLGTLIGDGTDAALTSPWLFAPAAGFLVVTVLAVNLVGDGLREALDPGSERGREARP